MEATIREVSIILLNMEIFRRAMLTLRAPGRYIMLFGTTMAIPKNVLDETGYKELTQKVILSAKGNDFC